MTRLLTAAALILGMVAATADPVGIGSTVPNVSIVKATGGRLNLKATIGKKPATILYFYSFESGADPSDFAFLQQYYGSEYKDLGVIALCVNGTDTMAKQWKKETGCSFDFVVDGSAQRQIALLFNVKKFPALFVINKKGMITHRFEKIDDELLRQAIESTGCKPKEE
jgi:peroxiredoxin